MAKVPTPKTARIGPYLKTIQKVRKAGWSWGDIRYVLSHLDFPSNEFIRTTYSHALERYNKGILEFEQISLPLTNEYLHSLKNESKENNETKEDEIKEEKPKHKKPIRMAGIDKEKKEKYPIERVAK